MNRDNSREQNTLGLKVGFRDLSRFPLRRMKVMRWRWRCSRLRRFVLSAREEKVVIVLESDDRDEGVEPEKLKFFLSSGCLSHQTQFLLCHSQHQGNPAEPDDRWKTLSKPLRNSLNIQTLKGRLKKKRCSVLLLINISAPPWRFFMFFTCFASRFVLVVCFIAVWVCLVKCAADGNTHCIL